MGGTHSVGRDNDELVDVLRDENYITSSRVEHAFRLVDRGDYISGFPPTKLYRPDQTLRKTDDTYAHLSAPCIYAKVVEALDVHEGNSFLNVGSGTGYLSTVIGNLLGPYALNHGVEARKKALEHSYECLERYITKCVMFDASQLAIPVFVHGNAFDLDSGYRKYDRIYVGAEVPWDQKHTFSSLLSDRGHLVMPYSNKLVCVKRNDSRFTCEELSDVSFRPLLTREMLAEEARGSAEEEGEEEGRGEGEEEERAVGEEEGRAEEGPVLVQHDIIQIAVRFRSLEELCRLHVYKLLGRGNLAKVRDLPISRMLQDYIIFYRDPSLPPVRKRPVYDEPRNPPSSRMHAILQDPPPRIGEYLGIVERFLEERRQQGAPADQNPHTDDDYSTDEEGGGYDVEEEEDGGEDERSIEEESESGSVEDHEMEDSDEEMWADAVESETGTSDGSTSGENTGVVETGRAAGTGDDGNEDIEDITVEATVSIIVEDTSITSLPEHSDENAVGR